MDFRCERDVLGDAVSAAARAATTRGLPVMAGVYLSVDGDRLTVRCTDHEIEVEATVTVSGAEDGSVVVPAKLLSDVIGALPPGAVRVHADVAGATIDAGRASFELRAMPVDDFPRSTPVDGPPTVVAAKEFVAAVRRVVYAASTDQSRPILCGVLVEGDDAGMRIVATDSYRLAKQELAGVNVLPDADTGILQTPGTALVPGGLLRELVRLVKGGDGDIEVRFSERRVSFTTPGMVLSGNLIEGDFPKYGALITAGQPGRLIVDRAALLDVVKQASVFAAQPARPVRFKLGASDDLFASSQAVDVGGTRVGFDASYDGPELTVGFNPGYLREALEACPGDEALLEVTDGIHPVVVTSTGDPDRSWLTLLMPVRVD